MLGLSPEYLAIERANAWINNRTGYRTDLELYGKPEFWEVANGLGDCEDYALAKRRLLLADMPALADKIRIAVVFTRDPYAQRMRESKREVLPTGTDFFTGNHAVLVVSVPEGDYILDCNYPTPMQLFETGYTIDRIQIAGTTEWEHGQDNGDPPPLTIPRR